MNNPVIHVEVLGNDAGALQRFYSDAFGWQFNAPSAHAFGDMDYRIAFPSAGDGVPAGVGGNAADGVPRGVFFYICVDDLEGAIRAVQNLGGKILKPGSQAPGGGVRVALIEDPEGNAIGLVDRASLG